MPSIFRVYATVDDVVLMPLQNALSLRTRSCPPTKKLRTDFYTQLLGFESDEWHVAHARNLEEENKLIEVGFEYVRYSEKDDVAIYRKRK